MIKWEHKEFEKLHLSSIFYLLDSAIVDPNLSRSRPCRKNHRSDDNIVVCVHMERYFNCCYLNASYHYYSGITLDLHSWVNVSLYLTPVGYFPMFLSKYNYSLTFTNQCPSESRLYHRNKPDDDESTTFQLVLSQCRVKISIHHASNLTQHLDTINPFDLRQNGVNIHTISFRALFVTAILWFAPRCPKMPGYPCTR